MSESCQFMQMNKLNQQYGINGYKIDKKYVESLRIIADREQAKIPKGDKKKHITKRGNIL
jgi:hypothetical protein